jgi:hypothetical protein
VEIEGVLEQKLVNGGSGGIRLTALRNRIFAISLRVHIKLAARQKHTLHPCEQPGHTIGPLVKWNDDGRSPGRTKGG